MATHMKPRQFIILVISIIAVGLGAYVAVTAWWRPPASAPPVEAAKLIAAVQAYSRDQQGESKPLPPSLKLRELVVGGYLTAEDVRAFEGTDVTFLLSADPSQPRAVMIRVRLRDGSQMVVLANGNVEHLPQ